MAPLGDIHRHIQLVNGMAKAHGVDLTEATHDGRLDQSDYAQMVTRCRSCPAPDACEATLRGPDGPHGAPSTCRNAQEFEALSCHKGAAISA